MAVGEASGLGVITNFLTNCAGSCLNQRRVDLTNCLDRVQWLYKCSQSSFRLLVPRIGTPKRVPYALFLSFSVPLKSRGTINPSQSVFRSVPVFNASLKYAIRSVLAALFSWF